jgi:plastocyanin
MPHSRVLGVIAVPVVLLSLAVAGCGGSSSSNPTSAGTTPSTTAGGGTSASGEALKLSADPSGALKFNTSSLQAKAGKVSLQMTNPSSSGVEHGIAVEGNGVDQDGQIVQPGNTSTLTVNLKPGKYEFYCPFDSHKQQGMEGTLTVK